MFYFRIREDFENPMPTQYRRLYAPSLCRNPGHMTMSLSAASKALWLKFAHRKVPPLVALARAVRTSPLFSYRRKQKIRLCSRGFVYNSRLLCLVLLFSPRVYTESPRQRYQTVKRLQDIQLRFSYVHYRKSGSRFKLFMIVSYIF